ncbi:MAG TPA: hypothetical protein VIH59_07485 [Candidatus Tectomicrobia bacterium]
METMMYRAYHRWMDDYCGVFPARITGVIWVSACDVAHDLEEIATWATKRWPLGLFVYAPYGMPLDHPGLEPYWQAAAEYDLGWCCIPGAMIVARATSECGGAVTGHGDFSWLFTRKAGVIRSTTSVPQG